jgi:hypothetical protein
MIYADAAARPTFALAAVACAGLVCLLLVSGLVLAILLYRRSRKKDPGDVA